MSRRDRWDRRPEDTFVSKAYVFMDFFALHKTLCMVILVIVAGAALAGLAYWNHLRAYNESALAAFESAKSAEEYKAITSNYPGSSVEPLALFYRGRKLLDAKQYGEASTAFSSFLTSYPGHPLAPNAMAFMGMILEQEKDFEGAVKSYQSLVERYPKSFVAPLALLNMGGCYERLARPKDAGAAYERIIKEYAASTWKADAEERLGKLGGDAKDKS